MTSATLNYLAPDTTPSVRRNGEIYTVRDADGNDAGTQGLRIEPANVTVGDGRSASAGLTLDHAGFERREWGPPAAGIDYLDHAEVIRRHYPLCEALVREASPAVAVVAFDFNVRVSSGPQSNRRIAGGQQVQAPARVVHSDYTLDAGPARLRDWILDEGSAFASPTRSNVDPDLLAEAAAGRRRFAIINVWCNRSSVPVQRDPMALCHASSIETQDVAVFEIRYPDRVGENYFAKHRAAHDWWCYHELRNDEALLIKQWDSGGTFSRSNGVNSDGVGQGLATFSFHTSFAADGGQDRPARESIEVRCFVLY